MEINLLNSYPNRNRDTKKRADSKTSEQIREAKKFGWEYFDKEGICYGGYYYDGRWIPVVKKFIEYYNLTKNSKILDIGCAKGFMLYDFLKAIPGLSVCGIDVSQYALIFSMSDAKSFLQIGNANDLSRFGDKEFDLVISINTIHNLKENDCRKAIREIERVGKHSFVTMDAYETTEEKKRIFEWNITAETILSKKKWIELFNEEKYSGDYYWFTP